MYPTSEDYFTTFSTSYTPATALEVLFSEPFILPQAIPNTSICTKDWETLWIHMMRAWQSKRRRGEEAQLREVREIVERANGGWFAKLDCDV